MIALDNGDKVRGIASVASVVDYTLHGTDANAIKQMADGQLPSTTGDLYTADSVDAVTDILLTNTHTSAVTVNLFLLPSGGVARRIGPKDLSLGIGHCLCINRQGMSVMDASGNALTILSMALGNLSDVTLTSEADHDMLYYDNATSLWKNATPATILAQLSGQAGAAFDWNSQGFTSLGVIDAGSGYLEIDTTGKVGLLMDGGIFSGGATVSGRRQNEFGGNFVGDGSATNEVKNVFAGSLTGFSGDTSFLVGTQFRNTIVTQTAVETIGYIAQVALSEPTITDNLTGDITVAATLYILGAPSEGETNAAYYNAGGLIIQKDTTNSSSATSGSIYTAGGIGIAEDLYCAKAINTPDGMGADGEQLTSGGDSVAMDWAGAGSLLKFKHIRGVLAPQDALDSILQTRPVLFNYRKGTLDGEHLITTGDFETVYAGVLAEEAPWVMHHHGKIFSPVSAFGYTVAAFQAMDSKIETVSDKIKRLEGEVAELKRSLN